MFSNFCHYYCYFLSTLVIDLLEQFNVANDFGVYIVPGSQSDLIGLGQVCKSEEKSGMQSDIGKLLGFYTDIIQALPPSMTFVSSELKHNQLPN